MGLGRGREGPADLLPDGLLAPVDLMRHGLLHSCFRVGTALGGEPLPEFDPALGIIF